MFKTPENDLKVPCGTPKSSKSILVLKHHETTMVLGIPQFKYEQIYSKDAQFEVFTIGGGCSVDLAPMSYLRQRYGPRMLLAYIDAHADLNAEWETPSGHFHGSMAIDRFWTVFFFAMLELQETLKHIFLKMTFAFDIGQCALKRSHLSYSDESKSASGTEVASHALCSQVSIRFGNVSKLASCNFTPFSIFMRAFPKMGAKSAGHFSSTLPILGYAPHFGQKNNYKNIHNIT